MSFKLAGLVPLLQVFDMPTSVRFYCDRLGFEIVNSSPTVHGRQGDYFHWAMLRREGIALMLNTAYDEGDRPREPDSSRSAAHRDTALFFSCPEVDEAYRELQQTGITIAEGPVITRYSMKQFTVVDPDGYHVCFQWPV